MKSKYVKLDGVKTFNQFWFGSCYYHQLYSAVACIGGNTDEVLMSNLSVTRGNYETEKVFLNDKCLKTADYRLKHFNACEKNLLPLIGKGIPVLVGTDCYEMKDRIDYYHKSHCRHFIMVYGFDTEKRIFYITDHDYFNDYAFKEKEITFEELFQANLTYRKTFCTGRMTSCVQVTKNKKRNEEKFFGFAFNKESMLQAYGFLLEDLSRLRECFVNEDSEFLLQNANRLVNFCLAVKDSRNILHCLENPEEIVICLEELITCYKFLWAILWKASIKKQFDFGNGQVDKIVAKIDVLIENEKKLNRYMIAVRSEYGTDN